MNDTFEVGGVKLQLKPFTFKLASDINEKLSEMAEEADDGDGQMWQFRFWLKVLQMFAEPVPGEDKSISDIDPKDYCLRTVQHMYRGKFFPPSLRDSIL